jgi:hypothetical protein
MTKKELLFSLEEIRPCFRERKDERYYYDAENFGDFCKGMTFKSKKEALNMLSDMKKSDFYKEDFAEYKRKKKEVDND